MDLFLSDGRPLDKSSIAADMDDRSLTADSQENYFYGSGANDAPALSWEALACQPPARWRATSSAETRGTTFYPVTGPYGPSQTPMTVTVTADRTVTKSAEVSGSAGISIGFLEAQTGVKLEGTVTTSLTESKTFTVPKGKVYRLLAQIIYRKTECARTAYTGPNCQPYEQTATVLTPTGYAFVVGNSTV